MSNPLKSPITTDELGNALKGQSVRLVTMHINDWYVKGQVAALVCNERKIGSYRCVESGKGNAVWEFVS